MAQDAIQSNKPSLLREMSSSLAFSGAIAGVGGVKSVIRNRGIKGAVESLDIQDFKKLNTTLKQAGEDVFSRGVQLSQNYDTYKGLAKKATKLNNLAAKTAKKGKLPLLENVKNLFRKEKLSVEKIATQADAATDALETAGKNLASGADIIEDAAKLAGKTTKDTAKNLFKSELKNKFVLGITILAALPRIKEEIIPAFKEKGFIEGVKTTAKVIARTGADFISNAGFSAVGRAIGSALGTVICPGVGSAVGGTFGDVIGSFFSMKLISKVFDKNKKENTDNITNNIANNTKAAKKVDMLG